MKLGKLDKIPVGLALLRTFLVLKGISYFKIKSKKTGREQHTASLDSRSSSPCAQRSLVAAEKIAFHFSLVSVARELLEKGLKKLMTDEFLAN